MSKDEAEAEDEVKILIELRSQRNAEIIEKYVSHEPVKLIASHYGLELQSVRLILKNAEVTAKDKLAVKPPPPKAPRALSPIHNQMGADISHRRIFELDWSLKRLALKARISLHKLVDLEQGLYDPTILELTRVGEVLNLSLNKLTILRNYPDVKI
jgi:tRNA threonylcarbamoyladenosine modification (KEOPS) complex  Pcc1 subunit